MSAEHNHPPHCCCERGDLTTRMPDDICPGCPEHGDLADRPAMHPPYLDCEVSVDGWCEICSTAFGPVYHSATPYTEQETTK